MKRLSITIAALVAVVFAPIGPPTIQSVTATDRLHVTVSFSEAVTAGTAK
jgi:hypothetical protein